MAEYLVIVESPGKLKSIKKFLGSKYDVAASVGHVRDLPKSKLGVDIENNFEPQYITIRGKADVINKLKKQAKQAKKVLLATDPDREGEAISWHLAHLLNIDSDSNCRISFNEITANAVKMAVKEPRKINNKLVDAQQARRVLDRVVGYKISPLLWKKVKKGLSAGRVQSVALKIICDRENEIDVFEPKEYWNLTAELLKKGNTKAFISRFYGKGKKKIELLSKEDVDVVLKAIDKAEFTVTDVKIGEKKRNPAPPFITSTLQQEASRKLNFQTRTTMMVAQKLYEGVDVKGRGSVGLITYMRTDSLRVSTQAMEAAKEYIIERYGKEYAPSSFRAYKTKSNAQDAHEAIRPTYFDLPPQALEDVLPKDQYKLYKLIWDRFMASQMSTAIYDTVSADIDANGYTFKASGSKVKFKGFTLLYTEGTDDKVEEKDIAIPELKVGEKLNLKSLKNEQMFTQPPPRYTEASLVKTLEEKGIGRPSTYSAIISTITMRGYVLKEKKILHPTELGMIINDLMKEYFNNIVDVNFTAQMETHLDKVEEGEEEWKSILVDFYKEFHVELSKAEEEISKIELPVEVSDVICDKCGKNMVVKMGRYGKFLACPGFPECRNIKPIIVDTGVKCPKCDSRILEKKSKKGKFFYGCENYKECDFVLFDKPTGEKCPKCESLMVTKYSSGKPYTQCSNLECKYKPDTKKDKDDQEEKEK